MLEPFVTVASASSGDPEPPSWTPSAPPIHAQSASVGSRAVCQLVAVPVARVIVLWLMGRR